MVRTLNILQLMLFHYVFAFEVMKERAEEAEAQADHLATLLKWVLDEAATLERALSDANQCSSEQSACALVGGGGEGPEARA